ncbi:hypothetical protein BASA50_007455 [Batrachochytrium salamandrivorans]|uniref:U2A'/phosphoprotein 32 family A C-terminal domain-containing protein n=1 Tax=Batrachochytrium salamandrivorans TaxID=1357716 RepID=A0ABQ8F9R8_9FUNG|nr:hypothetical protein BASA62_008824 [Batrachochytrium salamandrivorans]KAH6584541.1 hypothetical protein BASA60_000942 [Batrachochytrium salamandrivorans]KAH6593249.1 hypothetical protein BASA50_007455 [Batrachochytrium salamandrivorans]KAH9274149.1 hypothetical protein BASA83_003453 [Batrachochytrium salamandrivorans]
MVAAGSTLKQHKLEKRDAFLARISHVSAIGRGISNMKTISVCSNNLSVLFLCDNQIETIEGLGNCHNLTRLYLQNNNITILSGLDLGLHRLTVLNISENRIKYVAGLHNLPCLETLYADKQKLHSEDSVEFDMDSIAGLSTSLKCLTATGNNMSRIQPLGYLQNLQRLDIRGNLIQDVEELDSMLLGCKSLTTLLIANNPINDRYLRQRLILASSSLCTIDDKKITDTERLFLHRMEASKSARAKLTSNKMQVTVKEEPPNNQDRPYPHLPPYASQYRDLILQQNFR